jgi:hypothetical protein
MKIIAIIMAIAIVLFMFAPEAILKRFDIEPLNFHYAITTPLCFATVPPEPPTIKCYEESSAPDPEDNDGEY